VNLVAAQEGPLELVENDAEDVLVRSLRIVLSVLYIVGYKSQVSGDELRDRGGLLVLCEFVGGLGERGEEAVFDLRGVEMERRGY
jgi:hypothetical protein